MGAARFASDPEEASTTDRVALYVRVSTSDQDPERQERSLRSYADAQGWVVIESYCEVVTGTGKKGRPEFERLREAVFAHSVDTVLVVKLDRLGRSVRDVLTFFDECETAGARVVVTTQQIDTGTPAGRLARTILAGVAEFEGELIRERTRAAMRAIKEGTKPARTGQQPGRPRKVAPADVERARNLREKGKQQAHGCFARARRARCTVHAVSVSAAKFSDWISLANRFLKGSSSKGRYLC